jgi:hypothetical protein
MKKKIAYAVFTTTVGGSEMMIKGNFGDDEQRAEAWKKDYERKAAQHRVSAPAFQNPLFVKKIEY